MLVAPWNVPDEGDLYRERFYDYKIDASIKSRVKRIVMFTSDTERAAGKESLRQFHNALGGEVIELKGKGHYTFKEMKTEEFPQLLAEIK